MSERDFQTRVTLAEAPLSTSALLSCTDTNYPLPCFMLLRICGLRIIELLFCKDYIIAGMRLKEQCLKRGLVLENGKREVWGVRMQRTALSGEDFLYHFCLLTKEKFPLSLSVKSVFLG